MGKLGWAALGVLGVLVVLQVAEEATANEINQTHSEPYIHGDNVNSIRIIRQHPLIRLLSPRFQV